jgi:hypothetical protein
MDLTYFFIVTKVGHDVGGGEGGRIFLKAFHKDPPFK